MEEWTIKKETARPRDLRALEEKKKGKEGDWLDDLIFELLQKERNEESISSKWMRGKEEGEIPALSS